jgi:mono/diheme cytochrome c family protein
MRGFGAYRRRERVAEVVMRRQIPIAAACLAAGLICALFALGCGDDSSSPTESRSSGSPMAPETETPLTAAQVHGRDLFTQKCGTCHTLDSAGTVGDIGPNLDEIPVTQASVIYAIRNGGGRHSRGQETGPTGNMPRNLYTGKDAEDVADFVSATASGGNAPG